MDDTADTNRHAENGGDEERSILEAVNRKRADGWRLLYRRYWGALCAYVNGLLRDADGAEDIVQEIFNAMWETERKFADIEELTRYLYGACHKNVTMFFRNKQIHDRILEKLGEGEEEATDENAYSRMVRTETVRQLYAYIDELSTEQRKVLLLQMEGLSWEEIAREMGVSVNTAKTHRARAINVLRVKFKKLYVMFFCL